MHPQGDAAPLRPITGEAVTVPRNGLAFAAGTDVNFIDLGNQQRFTVDPQTLVVDETPLYAFALADADGFPAEIVPAQGGRHRRAAQPSLRRPRKLPAAFPDRWLPEFRRVTRVRRLAEPGVDV